MQQNTNLVAPKLNLLQVAGSDLNYHNVINAHYQEPAKAYLKDMWIDAKVTAKGSNTVIYTMDQGNMKMAPNSNAQIPIYTNGAIKAGTYLYHAVVYGQYDGSGPFTYKGQRYRYRWTFN